MSYKPGRSCRTCLVNRDVRAEHVLSGDGSHQLAEKIYHGTAILCGYGHSWRSMAGHLEDVWL